jgi:hypothetical protein
LRHREADEHRLYPALIGVGVLAALISGSFFTGTLI